MNLNEIKRLRQVEANTDTLARNATQHALEALEKVRADLRACHPLLAGAPGLVDTIIFALVGEANDPEAHALVRFVQARGRIEIYTAERDKAQALLASQGVTV